VEGDGWLVVRRTEAEDKTEHKFDNSFSQQFSGNNRWFAFRIGIPEREARQKRENQETIKYQLGLMDLHSAEVDTFNNIAGFEFVETGDFLLMRKYQPENAQNRGYDIILRDLEIGTNQLIGNVAEYGFNEEGDLLAILIDSYDRIGNGIQLIDLESLSTRVLETDEAEYRALTWNEEGDGIAFKKVREHEDFKEDTFDIFAITDLYDRPRTQVFNHMERDDFPEKKRIVDYRRLRWSEDGRRIFFGIKKWEPVERPEENDGTDTESEVPENEVDPDEQEEEKDPDAHLNPTNVEVWHWKDDPIQPRQRVLSQMDQQSNFLSVWHLQEDRFVQLTDDHDHSILLAPKENYAVLYDPTPHMPRFRESWNNIYVVDVEDGSRQRVLDRHESVRTSPGGDYLLYFRNDHWWSYHIPSGRHVNLTAEVDTKFNNFTFISGREQDRPFGAGQFAEDDSWVLLYDQIDIYKAQTDGNRTERITDGTDDEIRYRQSRLDWSTQGLDPEEPFYATIFGDRTKKRGYARIGRNNSVETLIYEPAMINRLTKADDTDVYLYMRQTAVDSPNFYRTDINFSEHLALTDTNPQQEEYHWGDDELISFVNDRGEELEGRLHYPANYEPGKQYPMIVYIYERRSQTLHNYTIPRRTSAYNQRRFSSEGYFVFEPDITYELRRPGMSAVESVVPAVEKVLETGMIDEWKIGLTGHSWGGYQTNFIITQTDMFASAVAGAPLTNMISMYNSVYWNTGMPDATIFEVYQGRFPDPYWKDWDNFIENSPIHQMEYTKTPLLLKFGTDDGAVDFNQGVELYNTMRRMEKPFVMLVYEGENHSLGRRENQIDFANRAMEWHEHYLLGKEPAGWIIEGLPFIERPEMERN
jgi:dipeptidyl aminopeptidase/acylaminoacyl peptidase